MAFSHFHGFTMNNLGLYKYNLEMSNSLIASVPLRLAIFIPPCHILIFLLDIIAYLTHFFYIFISRSDAKCIKMDSIKFITLGSLTATDSIYKPQTLIKTGFQSYFFVKYYVIFVAICSYLWYNMNMEVEYYEAYCK